MVAFSHSKCSVGSLKNVFHLNYSNGKENPALSVKALKLCTSTKMCVLMEFFFSFLFFITLCPVCTECVGLLVKDVPVVAVVTEEVKEQLVEASAVTQKAFTTYRREVEAEEHQAAADGTPVPTADKSQEEGEMSVIITIMQPILRLMQLLCENHNRDLQVSLLS